MFELVGAQALIRAMEEAITAAQGPQEYWVGSAVFYGPFHEFGTVKMAARPHWQPGIRLIAARYQLASDPDAYVNEMLVAPRGLVKRIAFDLEREVKLGITRLHIIDTGNYRGSISSAPTQEEAYELSESRKRIPS